MITTTFYPANPSKVTVDARLERALHVLASSGSVVLGSGGPYWAKLTAAVDLYFRY